MLICIFFPGVCMVWLLEGCYIFLGCSGCIWKLWYWFHVKDEELYWYIFFIRNGWVIQPNPSEINTHIIMVSWNLNHTNQVSHSLTLRQNHKKLRGHENMKITSYYCHDLLIDFLCCLNWNILKGKYFVEKQWIVWRIDNVGIYSKPFFYLYALSFCWWKGSVSYWKLWINLLKMHIIIFWNRLLVLFQRVENDVYAAWSL